jgi:hypothetical protein
MPMAILILPLGAPLTVSASVVHQLDRRGEVTSGGPDFAGSNGAASTEIAPRANKAAQVITMIRIYHAPCVVIPR